MERSPLHEAVNGWLATGPLSIDELADRAVGAGLASDDEDGDLEAIQYLLDRFDDYWLVRSGTDDELVVLASTFVETGMTFTHRASADELRSEALDHAPDLSVVDWALLDGLPLDDGSGRVTVEFGGPREAKVVGPIDWLDAVRPGGLLAFTRTDGVLSVVVVDESELGDGIAELEALRSAAERWIHPGAGMDEVPLVMEAMALDPSLFRAPVLPLGDLLVAAGLEEREGEWGRADEQWQTGKEQSQGRDGVIRDLFGLDDCCNRALDRIEDAWRAHTRGEAVDGRALAGDLGHGAVSEAFVYVHAGSPGMVAEFARAAVATSSGRNAAPALALLGLASLRAREPEAAIEALDAALEADPELAVAAEALAVLELDKGNLSRAHALAVQGDDPDLVAHIEDERTRQTSLRPTAGRNDPCPCGSGKKFKRCCAIGGNLSLAQRVPLVIGRVGNYATGPEGYDTLLGLALSAADAHDDVTAAVQRFFDDPFLLDVGMFEGGLGAVYLEERGPLLADDEVGLLETMLAEPLRLWEIVDVTPGERLTLRDTATGDEVTFAERRGSVGREPGELMLARVTSAAGGPMMIGLPLIVPLRQRDRLLDLLDDSVDADELAMWFGSLFLPPHMTNREGEVIVLRRTTVELSDATDAAEVLDATYERRGDGQWHQLTAIDEEQVVRSVLRLEGAVLTVESNSEERQDRILDQLEEVLDGRVVDDEVIDGLDDEGSWPGPKDVDETPDEVLALVEENMVEYEVRWIDEPVPALGGLTPRQALDDPTRREDLFALIRAMRQQRLPPGASGMSADRVERLLGITSG